MSRSPAGANPKSGKCPVHQQELIPSRENAPTVLKVVNKSETLSFSAAFLRIFYFPSPAAARDAVLPVSAPPAAIGTADSFKNGLFCAK